MSFSRTISMCVALLVITGCAANQDAPITSTLASSPNDNQQPAEPKKGEPAPEKKEPAPLSEQMKKRIDEAVKIDDPVKLANAVRNICRQGVTMDQIPMEKAIESIWNTVWHWGREAGKERVEVWEPLAEVAGESKHSGTIYRQYFLGLMQVGRRDEGLALWAKYGMKAMEELKTLEGSTEATPEALKKRRDLQKIVSTYAYGFADSANKDDRLKGAELAVFAYQQSMAISKIEAPTIQVADERATANMARILSDDMAHLLNYALSRAGALNDPKLNPLLASEPQTRFQFRLVADTGMEASNRVALGDIDDDGYVDVLVPGKGLYRNLKGSGKFETVNKSGAGAGISGAIADVNNDGRPDVLIATKANPGRLVVSLQNEDGSFSERTPTAGVYFPEGMGLFDGDQDGFIDVYLACYEGENTDDKVLRGLGDGRFEDVTEQWCGEGAKYKYAGRGVNPADYDNDGRTDVYVSNYRLCPNILWRNRKDEEGTTKLIDCAAAPWFGDGPQPPAETDFDRGVQGIATPYEDKEEGKQVYFGHTIGSVWGDLDNNGTLDLVCANLAHPRFITMGFSDITRVYLNRGSSFEDHTVKANITFSELHSDPMLADFDNDGYLDLSITNVYKHAMNQFYLGGAGATFREVTHRVGGGVFNGWGQAAGDFDNDGDLDLFITGILASDDKNQGTVTLYENTLIDKGKTLEGANFVKLKLVPPKGVNGMAYGARVTITAGAKQWTREVFGMRGTSSCDDQVIHVGLGAEKGPVDVAVRWMGDKASTHQSLAVNTTHRLKVE